MSGSPRHWRCLVVLGASLWLGACSPSYKQEQLVEAIQQLCATEHHLSVAARQAGRTIAVHLRHDGIFSKAGNQVALSPSANEVLGNLLEVIHRVTLSSNASLRFYVLLVSDPTVPGIYLTMVRYLDDVRRANANIIPPTEFFSRTIFELKYLAVPEMSFDQLIINEVQLEQFLGWQLAKRIQARLTERLRQPEGSTVEVGECLWEFQNGEYAFTLNVAPAPGHALDDELIQEIFQEATSEIAQVLFGYRFEGFEAVRLIHPPTGRSLLLPKTRLELFR